jgi:hypothetical protein
VFQNHALDHSNIRPVTIDGNFGDVAGMGRPWVGFVMVTAGRFSAVGGEHKCAQLPRMVTRRTVLISGWSVPRPVRPRPGLRSGAVTTSGNLRNAAIDRFSNLVNRLAVTCEGNFPLKDQE